MDTLRAIVADGVEAVIDEIVDARVGDRRRIEGVAGIVQTNAPDLPAHFPGVPAAGVSEAVDPGKSGADLQVESAVGKTVISGSANRHAHRKNANSGMLVRRAIHAEFELVQSPGREHVSQVHNGVGGPDRRVGMGTQRAIEGARQRIVHAISRVQRGLIVEVLIEADQAAVLADRIVVRGDDFIGLRVDRNLAHRVGVDDRLQLRGSSQDLGADRSAGHKTDGRRSQALAQPFIADKEEAFVLYDRPADATAKLIQPERRQLRRIKGRSGVQGAVAKKLENVSVELVGAGFRDYIDLCAAHVAVLGRIVGDVDAEFGDGIEIDLQSNTGLLRPFLNTTGIEAINGEVGIVAGVTGEMNAALVPATHIHRARYQRHQPGPFAAIERDFLDLPRLYHPAYLSRTALNGRCRRRYADYARQLAHLQLGVQSAVLSDLQLHA